MQLFGLIDISILSIFKFILLVVFSVIFLASIGKSLGVRRLFIKLLLVIFEYGRQNIEKEKKRTRRKVGVKEHNDDSDDEEKDSDTELSRQDSTSSKSSDGGLKPPKNNGYLRKTNSVISKEALILLPDGDFHQPNGHVNGGARELSEKITTVDGESPPGDANDDEANFDFKLSNCLDYIKAGMEAIIEDEVTSRFEAEELKNWNLLTRTNRYYEFISWRLSVLWVIGFFIRYFVLMPMRVLICFVGVSGSCVALVIIGLIPIKSLRHYLSNFATKVLFRMKARCISAIIRFHNKQYKPVNCGFCVANHTTPIDAAILASDCNFSLIGQKHGGFLGVLQYALSRTSPHIWFERAEAKDRSAVAQRLRQHVSNPRNPPILIFPEGTCINNTSVMQFKKGSFEVGGVIYPVAIKYDPRFGDPYWNSAKYSYIQYLFMMMTSWAIVCDVWYLPPMYRREGESAIDFANRVKSVIANQGGLVDLVWDGQLKRMKPKKEWRERQQEEFTKRLKGE